MSFFYPNTNPTNHRDMLDPLERAFILSPISNKVSGLKDHAHVLIIYTSFSYFHKLLQNFNNMSNLSYSITMNSFNEIIMIYVIRKETFFVASIRNMLRTQTDSYSYKIIFLFAQFYKSLCVQNGKKFLNFFG